MPQEAVEGSSLRPACTTEIPNAFIIENEPLERILFNRHLVGLEFTRACEAASVLFFRHFEQDMQPLLPDVSEYMLLTKGMYYWLHNAFATVFDKNLQANFAVTKRVVDADSHMRIDVPYLSVDAPTRTLVIGDTVASGRTICAALDAYRKSWPVERVFVFSIVGSRIGAALIQEYCQRHGIVLVVAFGLAAFGLAPNGFDLSFLHPETVCASRYVERARALFLGKPVSSAGWDFASQAQALGKYQMLCSLEETAWGLQGQGVFPRLESAFNQRLVEKEYAAFEFLQRTNQSESS